MATDLQGWHMMVVNPLAWSIDEDLAADGLAEPGETMQVTVTHELQHACQYAAGAWVGSQDLWVWEGLAHWTTHQVAPGNWLMADSVYGQALLPHLAWQRVEEDFSDESEDFAEQAGKRASGQAGKRASGQAGKRIYGTWTLAQTLAETWGRLRTGDFEGDRWTTTVWEDVSENPGDYTGFSLLPGEVLELLIVPGADHQEWGEGFDFGLSLAEPGPVSEEGATGCGCSTSAAFRVGWLLVLLPLGLGWRQRQPRPDAR